MGRHFRLRHRQHFMHLEEVGMHGRQRHQVCHGLQPVQLHTMRRQKSPIPRRALTMPARNVGHGGHKIGLTGRLAQIRRLLATELLHAARHGSRA